MSRCNCTPCLLRKKSKIIFGMSNVKLPPNLTILGTKMANSLKLYEVHSLSTSPNSRECTNMLNADVPNHNITV